MLEQKDIGEEIERLLRNYKKDGPARKTESRITQISTNLSKLWSTFESNHAKIEALDTEKKKEYFQQDYFAVVSALHVEATNKLKADLDAKDDKKEEDGKQIASERSMYADMLRANMTKFGKFDEDQNELEDLEFILNRTEKYYDLFTKSHFALLTDVNLSNKDALTSEYEVLTDEFHTLSVRIESAISQLKVAEEPKIDTSNLSSFIEKCMSRSTNDIRLPRIEVPKFDGDLSKWPEFRELFCTMIHDNKKLNDVQKIQYLKTQVSGTAAEVIKHFHVNANNYSTAWNLLNKRYNNKKLIINNNLKRLLTQRYIRDEKSSDVKCLLDTTKEIIYSLENYGEKISAWNSIICFNAAIKQRLQHLKSSKTF